MDRVANCNEDPRIKSNRYSKGVRAKFDPDQFEFETLQFLIDDQYVGQPPRVQISIDNLNDNINEEFLKKELTKLGKTRSLEIIRHPVSRAHLGMAKIQFEQVSAAQDCVLSWNNKHLMGRQLNVFEDPRFAKIERIKEEKLNPRPAPPPAPTISSISTFSPFSTPVISTPEPSSRPRLDDRIAILMKHPDSLLSTIVAQPPLPVTLCEYTNNSYYNDNRRQDINLHGGLKPYSHQNEPYHKYEHNDSNKFEEYSRSVDNNDVDWNNIPTKVEEPRFNILITESQLHNQILPHTFKKFCEEMYENLREKICRRLIERHGYPILEKFQNEDKTRRDKERLRQAEEKTKKDQEERYEKLYMAKNRTRPEPPKLRKVINVYSRRRENSSNHFKENRHPAMPQRINRSAAEPERRGSHNTCDSASSSSASSSADSSSESSYGSDDDESTGSSSSSSSSHSSSSSCSTSFSGSGSESGSESESESRRSRSSSRSPVDRSWNKSIIRDGSPPTVARIHDLAPKPIETSEQEAITALMSLGGCTEHNPDDSVKKVQKIAGTKRKKKSDESIKNVAPDYHNAKRFATDPGNAFTTLNENIENTMVEDENFLRESSGHSYQERSETEQRHLLWNLFETLNEEDVRFLFDVHNIDGVNAKTSDIDVPTGSIEANRAHLAMRTDTSCSRTMVYRRDQKNKPCEEEEVDYASLTMAPIKSHVIQAATTNSARRDHRGDQRRIAASNPEISEELLRALVSNTLKMRAKNLRFSRSKIHKWGLFACERIAKDEAVIEYVGEKIRPSVADHRENVIYSNSEKHDGSSYFFRVESDVIDATLKGNKARFINHSCNPNCIAKVIKHEYGSNSIVIYAKQAISADEEITYDYKFPREETDQKIRCNCRAPNCQKYLN